MLTRRILKPELSFVNLIDVTMVLLIIFMLAAPTIQQWVDVDLPSAKVTKAKITEGIIITIQKEGSVYIDREEVDFKNFNARFAEIWKNRSGEPVFIRADGEALYQRVIDIIGIAKKLGGENVGLVVEDEKKSAKK